MVARARLVAVLTLLIGLCLSSSSEAQSTLTVIDNSPFPDGPGDVAFVPGENDVVAVTRNGALVVSSAFNSGELITYHLTPDGRVTEVSRTPAGPEPRAIAYTHDGLYAVVVNSVADEIGVYRVGGNGDLREVDRVPSGGDNPYDVTVAFGHIVIVANRDSDQINTFDIDRHGRLVPLDAAVTGLDPHVVSVSRNGRVAVANQTDRSVSLYEVNRLGQIAPLGSAIPMSISGSNPPASMTPRTLSWRGNSLFVALDAPSPNEDVIRAFRVRRNGTVVQRGDTAAGFFLTDLEANEDGLFAVTVNFNNPANPTGFRDEVRFYRREGTELTLEAAVQTPGVPPSFKQITAARGRRGNTHILTTEFQGGWLRSFLWSDDDDQE